jgi:hypothetical protein
MPYDTKEKAKEKGEREEVGGRKRPRFWTVRQLLCKEYSHKKCSAVWAFLLYTTP